MTSTISEVVWPRPALAHCVLGMLIRDTRGCALDRNERFNFWPAELSCVVGCMVVGDSHLLDQQDQMERPWTAARHHSFFFVGPALRPVITWNPGEVYRIAIGFYPGAFSAMTGLDLSAFTGRTVPAEEALPQPMLEAFRNFFDRVPHEGLERSFSVLQDKIEIMWAGRRLAGTRHGATVTGSGRSPRQDWRRSLVHRAMAAGSGRSARQIARRVKSWTGVSERDLEWFGQIEQLALKRVEAVRKGHINWAALAAESGFADQAHMIKRYRKYTGFAPKQLQEGSRNNEAFWYYRLLGRKTDEFFERSKGQ
jgi:AraC-like DNA-binding protein